ncbi:MAG: aminoglycoside phosphotransferase family protein [Alphaproteobacteria bacterium]|nr:aminoglycoside phosphotransferase family protein [Alphaproteobacteria bacterium]
MTFKTTWEKADQLYDLSPPMIEGMVALAFPENKLASHEVISGGCANLNIKINLEGQAHPHILRIYLRDKEAAYLEQTLGRRLKDVIPIPQVTFLGDFEGHRFAILDFMDGIPFRDLLLGSEPFDMEPLMIEAGDILGKIQAIRFPSSGFFDRDLKIREPLTQEDYLTHAKESLNHPTAIDQLGKDSISKILTLLETHATLFPEAHDNHLVHGDFDPANLLVLKTDGVWKISGVLDWEFAFSASPLMDVAKMLRYAHRMPAAYESAFLKGLHKGGVELPEDWCLRCDLDNLLSLLDCLIRCPPDQRPNQCADICELIERILSRNVPFEKDR